MTISAGTGWRIFRAIMWGGAALLLLLPLVAMQFSSDVAWTLSDFIAMGVLLSIACGAVELGLRGSNDTSYRFGAIVAVAAGFLLIWVNLAVGFLGNEDNPANLMFVAVLAIAAGGSFVARSNAAAMMRVMIAAAVAQALIALVALAGGLGSPGGAGIYEAVMGTILFGGLWLFSALLFRRAALKQPAVA